METPFERARGLRPKWPSLWHRMDLKRWTLSEYFRTEVKSCTPEFSEYILYAACLYVYISISKYLFIYIYNDILCNCVFNISRPRSPCDLATSVPNAPKHCALRWRWKRRRRRCLGQHGERHVRGAPRRCLVKRSLNGWLFRLVRRLHDQWFLCIYII